MHLPVFGTLKSYIFIFAILLLTNFTSQIQPSSTSGGSQNYRVSLDPSDSKRLLCFCKKGSGVSIYLN